MYDKRVVSPLHYKGVFRTKKSILLVFDQATSLAVNDTIKQILEEFTIYLKKRILRVLASKSSIVPCMFCYCLLSKMTV